MPSAPEKYAHLTAQQRADQEKAWAYTMYVTDSTFRAVCNVPGCSGVEDFPWCSRETRDPEEAELWGQQHVYERHWQPVRSRAEARA